MRNRFDEQLEVLHVELITMGALCEDAISLSVEALLSNNRELLPRVFAADEKIDQKEREIEQLCMKLLLQQQPVASDLRTVSSALKMISDMERIGDQASDIAEICSTVNLEKSLAQVHIKEMAAATIKMVTDSVESFVKRDLDMAHSVIDYDDVVDDLFDKVKHEIISMITSEQSEPCIDLLLVAKYLERIGDHAENIAEWVEYSITGVHSDEES
mgnify:CR=1 FL=1